MGALFCTYFCFSSECPPTLCPPASDPVSTELRFVATYAPNSDFYSEIQELTQILLRICGKNWRLGALLGGITITLTTIVGILIIVTTITRNKPANRQDILPQAPRPVSHWRDLELASSRVTLLPGAWPFGKKNADYKQNISFKNYLT